MLGVLVMAIWLVMFISEPVFSQIQLINIIMTLGGLESYDATVIGVGIILFLLGITAIAIRKDS